MLRSETANSRRLSGLLMSCAVTALFAAHPAWAQTSASSPAAQPDQAGVEVIVVTARKQSESLQDVPMSISAVSGKDLEDAGYTELNDISRLSSNVYFEAADRSKPLIYIRGIGTRSYDAGSDPSVGVFVDGVYLGRFGALDMDLMDVARVELLRGPQGSLYGRNTIGGAISVVSRDPTSVFKGHLSGELGTSAISGDSLYSVGASLSGPIAGDAVRGSLSVTRRYREGYQPVAVANIRGGSEDGWSSRGKLMFDLGEATLRLSADYSDIDGPPLVFVPNQLGGPADSPGPLTPGFVTPAEPQDPYKLSSDALGQGINKKTYGGSAQLNIPFGAFELTSITAARKLKIEEVDDLDGTTLPFQVYLANEDGSQFSQEVRLNYETEKLKVLVGAFYSSEDVNRTETINFGPASLLSFFVSPAPLRWDFGLNLESKSSALFGQIQWEPTERLSLTLGGRYSEDQKDVVFDTRTTVPGFVISNFTTPVSRKWDSFDPSASLSYKFSDDVMGYVSYTSGFKSGAFQFIAIAPATAQQVANPESVDSYEAGMRTTLFDRRLRLNASIFSMDYRDLQQLRLIPIGGGVNQVLIANAASSRIPGLELEGRAVFNSKWSLDFSYGYLDAKYKNYVFNSTLDFSGNRLQRAPKNTLSLGLNFETKTSLGELTSRLGYSYRSKIFFEADNNTVDPESSEDGLGLLDASINLKKNNWTVGLWARNLSDERYRRQVLNSTGTAQRGIWAEPRTFGLRVSSDF
jgi:iron complex outermembrane recepter protein